MKRSILKRTPLRRASKKRAKQLRVYSVLKNKLLADRPFCEVPQCGNYANRATQIHHIRGRIGELLNDTRYFLLVCSSCHTWIHSHPNQAREKGLLK